MSLTPTRAGWEMPLADPVPSLEEGNRVLASIARKEALRALRAFSDLHEQIRNERLTAGPHSDQDMFQTERFVRDEVLQLICDRVQELTQADAIVVAVAEGSDMVCRAAAGPMPVPRGAHLNLESQFLRDCLQSGEILRSEDSASDPRIELDLAHQLGARATVLIPLRGRSARLGVLQAFSSTPWSFTDQDVRCFDLFVELVLAALKPDDQDRRIRWLSDVAGKVLQPKPAAPASVSNTAGSNWVEIESSNAASPSQSGLTEFAGLTEPVVIPVATVEVCDAEFDASAIAEEEQWEDAPKSSVDEELFLTPAVPEGRARSLGVDLGVNLGVDLGGTFLASRPGLSVVLGLVAVAALFSAGVWWGMQVHGKVAVTKIAATGVGTAKTTATDMPATPGSGASPAGAAPGVSSPASDNLMDPAQAASPAAALIPVPDNKLAALPKITGVRHWSSSIGSTVVIDMEDQVPYEVHRLTSPERIYFDLHDTVLTHELDGKTMDVGDVSLTRVRVAQPVTGVTRIVLDTKGGSNFSVSMESNPYRLVVELRDSVKSAATNRVAPVAPAAVQHPATELSAATSIQPLAAQPLPAKTGKFRIVLDAGHGGWDLGTVGRQGLLEKDLVLDVTERLGKLLHERLGSEVMLTRTSDEYLPLDQRADFANQAQADLFVSVHANYSSSATARGVETYYTNLFSAPGFKEVEKHADGTFTQPTPISLYAEGLHEKIEESRRLAASVQHSLYATLAAKSPDIRNRGIKDSAFAVLTGTTMPAILTEISFVSSPEDEHNLQSGTYRQQIAEALYKGIAHYQESFGHAKVAQLQPAAARR